MSMSGPAVRSAPGQIRLLQAVVFLIYLAQMSLNPIIAPLSRRVGLAEWQVGLTISMAAMMVVGTSQVWGRRSQSWGRRPVLLTAFGLATTTMTGFAVLAYVGMAGVVGGTWLFILFALFRGVGFGTAIAAVPPTAQAYIADLTTDERTRVNGMAGIGAAQGIAMVSGAVLGGGLAYFGILTPLVVIPVLLLAGMVLILRRLPRQVSAALVHQPRRVRPFDSRVWPFLVAGFGMFTSLGFIQVITGFLVQDRLRLGAEATSAVNGGTLLTAGLGMFLAQTVIVPRSGWSPVTLMRVGSVIALAGFAALIPDIGAVAIFLSVALTGVGLGIATPGYVAGPTLLVSRDEQGGLAGLIAATNGLTFVVAPTVGTALYGWWPQLPMMLSATMMAAVALFVALHPRFRQLPDEVTDTVTEDRPLCCSGDVCAVHADK